MIISGKNVGRIGLGCVTFGREIDQAASFAMMDHALANGIHFFDTAAAYGAGASERIIGEWLSAKKHEANDVVVATKILPPYHSIGIVQAVDECRRRLQRDTIDLLFLHAWHDDVLTTETLTALDGLIRSGAVKQLGASNFHPQQLEMALEMQKRSQLYPFRFAQNNHNYAVRHYDSSFQKLCKGSKIKMITYSPLGAGFLTGKHQLGVASGSRFDVVPAHQSVYFTEEAQNRLKKLLSVAEKYSYNPVQLALAWAMKQPAEMVLTGGRHIHHLDQAFSALIFHDEKVLKELEDQATSL